MRDALVAADINPDAQPQQDLSEIDMLVDKVPELARLNEEGGNPNFEIRSLDPGEMGRYDQPSKTALINHNAFSTYLYLAYTVGHELNHAIHFHSGLYQRWLNYMPSHAYDIVRKYSEYRSYQ